MIDVEYLAKEAKYLRNAMELCAKEASALPTPNFPVMNCKFASLLLAYHYFQLFDDIEINMVSGFSENMVSHVWLEIEGYVFDVTGDQYNIIEDEQLNPKVTLNRPYPKVHVEEIGLSYLYQLFDKTEHLLLERSFMAFKVRFITKLEASYRFMAQSMIHQ
ncbi:hypothetical protein [Vibrio coralliilyticus]|uniref:hypothetical protein n=1 Tax=Vibrio coralliilyticus TaxID=190893 RepID=UPI00148CCC7E|nr:hypothetical protein [Vibrio coralliilyticus]NOI27861.1 hypothetical protein [Vibrio coralliilyticus]NOI50823.1 hypothetical protein [Vibrio coralliilyticus]